LRSGLLFIAAATIIAGVGVAADQQDDLQIWHSFREALRTGRMLDPERYRPITPELRQPMMGFLEELRKTAKWEDGGPEPEVFHVGNQIHYVVPLTLQHGETTSTTPFCFTLVMEGGQWYFQHLESIFIRLDKIPPPPVSSFPDLAVERKAWMRDEFQTTKDVQLFAYLSQEKGKQFAFDWFKDGPGYAIQAQTWVPFVPPARAFILYVCWDLSNLRSEPVVLEKLSDEEARLRFTPRAFALYDQTAEMKPHISLDDYRHLFEMVWRDRARSAGWNLSISYEKGECVFRFVKPDSQPRPEAKGAGDQR